jgi:type VI protein secretion system component Hcp
MSAYIKIGDIKGESMRPQSTGKLGTGGSKPSYYEYKLKNVMISSYDVGRSSGSAPGSTKSGVGGRGTLKVNRAISASPSSFRAIATGSGRLKSLTLVDDAPGHGLDGTCTFALSGVKIAEASTKNNALPSEEIAIAYEKIEWTYSTGTRKS